MRILYIEEKNKNMINYYRYIIKLCEHCVVFPDLLDPGTPDTESEC